MKKFLTFVDEYCIPIIIVILIFGLFVCIIIGEWQFAKSDLFVEEEKCYSYYKENGFILDACKKYEEKFLSLESE